MWTKKEEGEGGGGGGGEGGVRGGKQVVFVAMALYHCQNSSLSIYAINNNATFKLTIQHPFGHNSTFMFSWMLHHKKMNFVDGI